MIGHGIYFSASEDIKHPPVGFFDGAKLHKGHFALSLPSFEAAPYMRLLLTNERNPRLWEGCVRVAFISRL